MALGRVSQNKTDTSVSSGGRLRRSIDAPRENSFFVFSPLGVKDKIFNASAEIMRKQYEYNTPEAQRARLVARDMSKDVISAAPAPKRAPLGRVLSAVLPGAIANPINNTAKKVGNFFAPPSFSDQMVRALEENPNRTLEELRKRAIEFDREDLVISNPTDPNKDRFIADDFTGGTIRRKLGTELIKTLAGTKSLTKVTSILKGELNLSDEIIRTIAPKITESSNSNIVENIVRGAVELEVTKPKSGRLSRQSELPTLVTNKTPETVSKVADDTKIPQKVEPKPLKTPGILEKATKPEIPVKTATTPLHTEAKKYKSAEEFVKARGKEYHHYSNADFKEFKTNAQLKAEGVDIANPIRSDSPGIYFFDSTLKGDGGFYGKNRIEAYLDIKNPKNVSKDFNISSLTQKQIDYYREQGFDAIVSPKETVVFEPSQIKTKAQLTDIWNKANQKLPALVKTPEFPAKTTTTPLHAEAKKYKTAEEFATARRDPLLEYKTLKTIDDEFVARGSVKEAIDEIGGIENVRRGDVSIDKLQTTETINQQSERFKAVEAEVDKGIITPIVVDDALNVVDGHHRLEAYRRLGMDTVPVVAPSLTAGVKFETRSKLLKIWEEANQNQPTPKSPRPSPEVGGVPIDKESSDVPLSITRKSAKSLEKLQTMVDDSGNPEAFIKRTGLTKAAADATVQKIGYKDAADFYTKNKKKVSDEPTGLTEVESLEQIAEQEARGEYGLEKAAIKDAQITDNLTEVFASLKGVDVADLKQKFSEEDLYRAEMEYNFVDEAIRDDPAGALMKYRVPAVGAEKSMRNFRGLLPEVTGLANDDPLRKTMFRNEKFPLKDKEGKKVGTGSRIIQKPYIEFKERGDDIVTELGFKDSEEARNALEAHLKRKADLLEYETKLKEIRHNIRLAQGKDAFIGKEKNRLAREFAGNLTALKEIVKAAEKAGFKKGLEKGKAGYNALININKERRTDLQRIKHEYNLTDTEWRTIRRQPVTDKEGNVSYRDTDWRELNHSEFTKYVADVKKAAQNQYDKNREKVIINALVEQNNLSKIENLQRAMELPKLTEMSVEQLRSFSDELAKTEYGGEFLSPRMIQTLRNTDLGETRTVGEALKKVAEKTGMEVKPVMGDWKDDWLRVPTLAAKDPFHNLFMREWLGSMAEMGTRKFHFEVELDKLKKAADKSRRKINKKGGTKKTLRQKVYGALIPEDRLVVKWLQPYRAEYHRSGKRLVKDVIIDPKLREDVEKQMTPEEVTYAKFLENTLSGMWEQVAKDAEVRWTLRGVKHSNYRGVDIDSVYFPHSSRSFLEQSRDDGFFKTLKKIFSKELNESEIDFNAFGDRGQVLGYEKWFKNNVVREGEGVDKGTGKVFYSQNSAKTVMRYYHALEKKRVLDDIIPKIQLYESLMGKRRRGPASITDPEGTEQVDSTFVEHVKKQLNTFKGQKAGGYLPQGSRAEGALNALSTYISLKYLGANVIAQVISGAGGQITTYTGIGLKGWAKGHKRALTKQGREVARLHAGIIGEPPWWSIAKASNDAGDTLRAGLYYGFGDLQFRAVRQMFLGMLTKTELKTGVISRARQEQIRLRIGEWHPMHGDASIHGGTAEISILNKFTEWAIPAIQTTYVKNLPRVYNMLRTTPPKEWPKLVKTDEFQVLFRTVVAGAATTAIAYSLLSPDENDSSMGGYMRRKAAQEISTIVQAITVWGVPIPGSVVVGYLDGLRTAMQMLIMAERYKESGPGHKEGDLKGWDALAKQLVPSGYFRARELVFGEPETPPRTKADIKKELKQKLESGELSESAAQTWLKKELASLKEAEQKKRLALPKKEFKAEIKKQLESGKMTEEEAAKEIGKYLKETKKYSPESFESNSDADFIGKLKISAKALGTDPVTLFQAIFTDEKIRRMENGEIILHRGKSAESTEQRTWAVEKRKELGANKDLILEHRVPLSLGGDNSDSNLYLVPKKDHDMYTPVEVYLWQAHASNRIKVKEARRLILELKEGKKTPEQIYAEVDGSN